MVQRFDTLVRRARPGLALVGLGFVLLGLMVAFPERLKVPAPVGYLTAGTLVLAGLLALANSFCGRKSRAWLAVVLLICMVLPAAWIAMGAGPRTCSIRADFLIGSGGGLVCRTAFGIGSVLGLVLVLVAVRYALAKGDDED